MARQFIIKPGKEQYPELYQISLDIANKTCCQINERAETVHSEMPYKAQFILEELIKILEERV